MPYYLKITYNKKIKKFIVPNPKVISVQQIKNNFMPPISSKVKYILSQPNGTQITLNSDSEFTELLKDREYVDKAVVRISIEDEYDECEGEKGQMEELLSTKWKRSRSGSQQMPDVCLNQSLEATIQFLYNSLENSENSSCNKIKQSENLKKMLQQKEAEVLASRRQTNLHELLQFLRK